MKTKINRKEYILCAAIKYKDSVICGHRHSDCYKTLKQLTGSYTTSEDTPPTREDQGFITSLNRYVTRNEAYLIAKEMNQMWHNMHDGVIENILISEDLY